MNRTLTIAPVRKVVVVRATPERAFDVFTAGIDRWWPKTHSIGSAPIRRSVIEPREGGRWYATCEDGSDAVVGHVSVWQPGERLVMSWEVSSQWKPDPRPGFASEIEVRFIAEPGGGTRVELEHRNFERMGAEDGQTMRSNVDDGWPGLLALFAGNVDCSTEVSSMDTFVVHSVPGSTYGRAVLVALEEKGARYRVSAVPPGTLNAGEHLMRHPFGRVPVLDHGQFRLYECQAILRYIDRVCPAPALTPVNVQDAGRMDQLLNINDWYLFQGVVSVIGFQRIVGPKLLGLTTDEAAVSAALPKGEVVFAQLASQLGDKPYFVGPSLTLADILLSAQLDFLTAAPEWEILAAPHENLRTWLQRMNSRPSMSATTWDQVARMALAA